RPSSAPRRSSDLARATDGLRPGRRFRHRRGLIQIQTYLLGLRHVSGIEATVPLRELLAEGRLRPLAARDDAGRAEQFIARPFRQILEIAFQLEADSRAAAHAPPPIKKNPHNDQKADND